MVSRLSQNYFSPKIVKSFKFWPMFMSQKRNAHVVMTDDSSTIVCWHPEQHFPYEKSLPIPEKQVAKSDSVLKVQSSKQFLSILKPKSDEVVREELMKLTFSTKHIWFPKKHQFRRKKQPDPDRPYLINTAESLLKNMPKPIYRERGISSVRDAPDRLYTKNWAHFPKHIDLTPSKSRPSECCTVHHKNKKCKETTRECKKCKIPLHVPECFELYYTITD